MTQPPMAYYGGKSKLADRIVSLLPPHDHYVEPFAGSLAVLLAKPRAVMETVNDIDGDLVAFWRVLRDRPEDLARVMALTPHSRAEHDAAYDADPGDDLERARRVWVMLSQGRGGRARNYKREMATEQQHRELAAALHDCRAAVVLSGYDSPLYADLFHGWYRVDLSAWTGNGGRDGSARVDGRRTEVLWANRPLRRDVPLFDLAEAVGGAR